ncbi:1,4-alpha-glucan-branching enzyme-like [Oopsacas minuta]|uniref:1,4-alpha-glucan branching enzyme n=1 Tax=Oopsacas minuta TaxID=111878 RepID=A0AAV7JEW9_9METZ|nr:1,4-alpha-glucan-branching enzyme-like [Oopsacas minuta]
MVELSPNYKTLDGNDEIPFDPPPDLHNSISIDNLLKPYKHQICYRYSLYKSQLNRIEQDFDGGLNKFSSSYKQFGLISDNKTNTITCREWVPFVCGVSLVGDFNKWDKCSHPLSCDAYGTWSLSIQLNKDGDMPIKHKDRYKLAIQLSDGSWIYRVSPWAKYLVQNDVTIFESLHWAPDLSHKWQHPSPPIPKSLRVYESHVGISSWEGKISSYTHFTQNILPYIRDTGYNCIQLMAIQEHAYYASFGYQVTNLFATSSRYGTPEELKLLIDTAHGMKITVLLDIIHSHSSKNIEDGLNMFNGTTGCYFHENGRGEHEHWDTKLFNYNEIEVLRLLLSNLRWFLDEYHFDGFRFDGITSMLYHHHGNCWTFSGSYDEYFGHHTDLEAGVYIMLANHLIHSLYPNAITVAEDVSGMPTLCRPVSEGGYGFDYRLAMAIPDLWIKLLKEIPDQEWNIGLIVHTHENRRFKEQTIAYTESHDQALVGDKTLAFWLMDAEMYQHMSVLSPKTLVISRGMCLHMMLRLLTMGLGGEGYLTFMGNEFGHPEWLDFPREGNGESYHYARRQIHLISDKMLRYKYLYRFEQDMHKLEEETSFLSSGAAFVSLKHESDKLIVFERAGLIFVFNFHIEKSYTDYPVGVTVAGGYNIILCSDDARYDGKGRVDCDIEYVGTENREDWHYGDYIIKLYVPSRALERPNESYTTLLEKLTERLKLPLLAAVVDKELNEQIQYVRRRCSTVGGTTSPISEFIAEPETEEPPKKIVLWFYAEQLPTCNAHWGVTLDLQQEYDMYINGGVASDYDEDPMTYWATVQHPKKMYRSATGACSW